tara:strand:+ start:6176 stop:6661 length:486 start_codon:yes stop_codon:yes gene_type:complete
MKKKVFKRLEKITSGVNIRLALKDKELNDALEQTVVKVYEKKRLELLGGEEPQRTVKDMYRLYMLPVIDVLDYLKYIGYLDEKAHYYSLSSSHLIFVYWVEICKDPTLGSMINLPNTILECFEYWEELFPKEELPNHNNALSQEDFIENIHFASDVYNNYN